MRKKILIGAGLVVLLLVASFVISTYEYQKMIDSYYALGNEHCKLIDPIIADKRQKAKIWADTLNNPNSTDQDITNINNQMLDVEAKYIDVTPGWLQKESDLFNIPEYKIFMKPKLAEAYKAQHDKYQVDFEENVAARDLMLDLLNPEKWNNLGSFTDKMTASQKVVDDKFKESTNTLDFRDRFIKEPTAPDCISVPSEEITVDERTG